MKRFVCLILCLAVCLCSAAGAVNLWDTEPASEEEIRSGAQEAVQQGAEAAGDIVNPDSAHQFTDTDATAFSYTPLDVVLVMDTSGSMGAETRSGQQVLSLAQQAGAMFIETLFGLSASSRIGLIHYASDVTPLTGGLLGLTDENYLKQLVYSPSASGSTNTGGAMEKAGQMSASNTRADARKVFVILTDGQPNTGPDTVTTGRNLRREMPAALIYTVGLVGALGESEKETCRRVLNDGYETRYFEVDNRAGTANNICSMGSYTSITGEDVSSALSAVFAGICAAALAGDENSGNYMIWVDEYYDIRVTDRKGSGYLSSDPNDYSEEAPFGRLSIVGENKGQKNVTLMDKDDGYTVTLRGVTTARGSYSINGMSGVKMIPTVLASADNQVTHPAQVLRFDLDGLRCTKTDLSWDPLDHTATDPFTGKPTRGSETAASGRLVKKQNLLGWTDKKAESAAALKKGDYVQVLASTDGGAWMLAAATDKDGLLCRGWLPADALAVDGYVPALIRDAETAYTAAADTEAKNAPSDTASAARTLRAGETVTAIHAERDLNGREWAYVKLPGKKPQAAWVPADSLAGWQPVSPEGFRIGYALPTLVWQKTVGTGGFTEFMWAASREDAGGVALSGRTSAKGKDLKAAYGKRDAFAMLLKPDGTIEKSAVWGGSGDYDSFHCILPDPSGGYFVSGVTRSNDKAFANIWDTSTYSGSTSAKLGHTNALIGRLDGNLDIDWMKSFGTGGKSYGFDMVVETADGQIAGCGWLNDGRGFALNSYGGQDFLVMKLTKDGRLAGYSHFGGGSQDVPDSAVPTKDGGLIMVGNVGGNGNATGLIYLIDANLQETGRMTYGGKQDDIFDNIRDQGDGTYMVTGFTSSYSGSADYWAMEIDSSGRMIWSKTYGGSGRDEVCGTTLLPDGQTLLVGYTTSSDGTVQGGTGTGKDAWAVCIDQTGRVLWQYTSALPGDDYFNSAAMDPDDYCVVLAGCRNYKKGGPSAQGYVVKLQIP